MRILLDKSGKGQLEVLSRIAAKEPIKQKEVVEDTFLSKGAISNNVRKLEEKNLIENGERLELNREEIRKLYREHIETFLIRDSSEPEPLNELRTYLKRNAEEIVGDREITDKIVSVLEESGNRDHLESLNSVFRETDRVLRESQASIEEEVIGIATDKSSTVLDNPGVAEEAQRILEEVQE